MDTERPDAAGMLRAQSLAADLAIAIGAERRRRRRLDEALRGEAEELARRTARLDKATRRVAELIDELGPVLRSVRRELPGTTAARATHRPAASLGSARPGRPPTGTGAAVASAVDIGSNSVHLLVAVVSGHRLEPLLDESEFLGLGATVDEHGEIGPYLRARLATVLEDYTRRAATLGSRQTVMVGTDPLRRAGDAEQALAAIEAATGARPIVASHDEEAFLTLLGVTAGRPVRRSMVLVDIGGGSSEVLWIPAVGDPVAVGLPTGSARLTRRLVHHDPPTPAEIDELLAESRRLLGTAPEAQPDEVVIVGGSATNLLRIVPAAALDRRLTAARVREALRLLASETASEAATRHGLREPRARMMVAGAAIVLAVIERFGVERVRVDRNGIREGLVLASAHAGDDWREHLVWLAHGWSR